MILMLDKILAKEEFCKKLEEAKFTSSEIDEFWKELLNIFYAQVLLKGSMALTPEQQKEAVGKEDVSAEEIPQMFEDLSKYLQEHAKDLDVGKIFKSSVEEAHKIMAKRLLEEGENG